MQMYLFNCVNCASICAHGKNLHHRHGERFLTWTKSEFFDPVDRSFLFHGAWWGTIALLDSGTESSMFHSGPLPVGNALGVLGSHEKFQSRWTISTVRREHLKTFQLPNLSEQEELPNSRSRIIPLANSVSGINPLSRTLMRITLALASRGSWFAVEHSFASTQTRP